MKVMSGADSIKFAHTCNIRTDFAGFDVETLSQVESKCSVLKSWKLVAPTIKKWAPLTTPPTRLAL